MAPSKQKPADKASTKGTSTDFDKAAATDAKPADAPVEKPDDTQLTDTSPASISRAYRANFEAAQKGLAKFKGTLGLLSALINRVQSAGMEAVGVEVASSEKLRKFYLVDNKPQSSVYCILSMEAAQFLLRIHPDNKIDCYATNLNKLPPTVQAIDTEDFWMAPEQKGSKKKEAEPKYFQHDLSDDADAARFLSAVIQSATVAAAQKELTEYDCPAQISKRLPKISMPRTAGSKLS